MSITVNGKSVFIALVSWAVLYVGACAPVKQTSDSDQTSEGPTEPVVAVVDLPKQNLTSAILGDLLVADLAYYRDDIATSLEILEKTAFETRDPRIAEIVSVRAIGFEEYDIASNTADLWVELSPQSASAWNAKGVALVAIGELDEAVASFQKVLEHTANQTLVVKRISGWLSQKLPPPTAYEVFEKLLMHSPDNIEMHLAMIELATWVKESDEIDALFDDAFRLAGQSDSGWRCEIFSIFENGTSGGSGKISLRSFCQKTPILRVCVQLTRAT